MQESELQVALWDEKFRGSEILVPNYTPAGWFEADVMRVTKSGYFEEFEIKTTVPDFRKDVCKRDNSPKARLYKARGDDHLLAKTKYERMEAGDLAGPCRFYYVIPEALLVKIEDEIPAWAGIYSVGLKKRCYRRGSGRGFVYLWAPRVSEHRKAKKLHGGKIDPKVVEHAKGVFYWRFWHLLKRVQPKHEKP